MGYLRWTMVTSFYNHGHSQMLLSLRTIIFMRYPPTNITIFLPEFDDNMEKMKLRTAKNFCTKPHQDVVDLPYNPLISINDLQYGIQSWGFNITISLRISVTFQWEPVLFNKLCWVFFFWCSTNHSRGPRGDHEMRQVFKQWAIDKGLLRPAAQGARRRSLMNLIGISSIQDDWVNMKHPQEDMKFP